MKSIFYILFTISALMCSFILKPKDKNCLTFQNESTNLYSDTIEIGTFFLKDTIYQIELDTFIYNKLCKTIILKLINQSIETTKITRINTTGSGFIYNGPLTSNGNFQYKDYEKYARKETLSFIFLEEFYRPTFSKSILIWFTDVSNKEKRMQINIKGCFEKSKQN